MNDREAFMAGALQGFVESREHFNFDDLRPFVGAALCPGGKKIPGMPTPFDLLRYGMAMEQEFLETKALWEEVKDYIDPEAIAIADQLTRRKMFVAVSQSDVEEAKRIMSKAIKDAREKKARCEAAAKAEAEYQQRKAATRAARPVAPEPEVKELPAIGAPIKKDADDEFAAFSGAGKKGKRK